MKLAVRRRWAGPAAGLVGVWLLFAALAPASFRDPANLATIARQASITGTAALGATLVIVGGGIDLSVGSVVALTTVVVAGALAHGLPPLAALLAGCAAGAACGIANGILVTRLRIVPFIVTLGTMLIVRGLAKGLAGEQKIDAPLSWLNDLLATLPPDRSWQLAPPGVWITLGLGAILALVLQRGRAGREVFALGGNPEAARLSGIATGIVALGTYAVGGVFAGVAGVLQFSRLTVGDPTVAAGLELDAIGAVVIGGGSLAGGEGTVAGSLLGALIMTTIRSGCSQMGLANWVQEVVTGSILVVAVALDRLRPGIGGSPARRSADARKGSGPA